MALKGMFVLLSQHGLDSPAYYTKLYSLLKPSSTKSVFDMDLDTKSRFTRLLDLSLRAHTLPSKLIAAFMKRLAREIIRGSIWATNDILFTLALIANLAKRHTRTYRLITRKKNSLSLGQ
jgi:U3 small nucleolar RNA-associated protein 19